MKYSLCIGFVALSLTCNPLSLMAEQEIIIDTVLASVDGKPITLLELSRRMSSSKVLSQEEVADSPEARQMLEGLIFERLVEEESNMRRIRVDEGDVDAYIEEISRRNQLSKPEFIALLKEKQLDEATYRQQVKFEILRTRLMGQIAQSGGGVSEKEIEQFVSENPSLSSKGSKIKLAHLLISKEEGDAYAEKVSEVSSRLAEGDDFEDLVEEFSRKNSSGALGVMREEDLSPQIFDAVLGLKEGETSSAVEMEDGAHFFHVLERYQDDEKLDERLKEEVRAQLEAKKAEQLVQDFFQTELAKAHSVDRKI